MWRNEGDSILAVCSMLGNGSLNNLGRNQWNKSYSSLSLLLITIIACSSLTSSAVIESDSNRLDSADEKQCFVATRGNSTIRNRSATCLLSARVISGTQPVANNDLIPNWINHTLFKIGQEFASKNIGYLGIGHFFALIFENFIPDIKNVLLTTGSTNTMERAVKRYTATATQVLLWYRNSLNDPTERETLLSSLYSVRKLHLDGALKVQNRLRNDGDAYLDSKQTEMLLELWQKQQPRSVVFDERFWDALAKDLLTSKIPKDKRTYPEWKNMSRTPISQFAQTLTQFSFVGLPVLFHRELGITQVTKRELHGFVHMWAVLGHALGIKDDFNICLNDSFEESIRLFRDIFNSYFIPAMFQFDWRVRVQLGAYLDALHHMDQVITPRLIMFRFLRDIVKINPIQIFQQMNAIERMYLGMIDSLLSNNLDASRFLVNRGGMFLLDVNGYNSFGSDYSSDLRKSRRAFYTKEKLLI